MNMTAAGIGFGGRIGPRGKMSASKSLSGFFGESLNIMTEFTVSYTLILFQGKEGIG